MSKQKSQHQLIMDYIREHGSILPAKMGGIIYQDVMFGSETPARCRELRKKGLLVSFPDAKNKKFQRFFFRH